MVYSFPFIFTFVLHFVGVTWGMILILLHIVVLCLVSIRTSSHSQLGKLTMSENEKTVLSENDYNSKGMICTVKKYSCIRNKTRNTFM